MWKSQFKNYCKLNAKNYQQFLGHSMFVFMTTCRKMYYCKLLVQFYNKSAFFSFYSLRETEAANENAL